MRQIKKIAITNEKGGVGKTMTAVNLSACLAQRGYRVLLIDADPQGYATLNYDVAVSPSLLEVLRGQATCTETVQTTCFGVDVLPSDRTLSIIEEDLIRQEMNGAPYLNTLEKALEDLADYDFVIIDCPPQGGRLMDIVHYYADAIIMPMFAEDYGIHALTLKAEAIADMDKLTGEKLLVNGQEIIAETTFIAEAKNGSVDVTFVFDATGLHGKEIVVFEDLYRENIKVAAHADITDDDQTIKVKTPEIGTTASFEGEKEIDPLDKVTLTDTVSYKDLTPGKEYRVTGVLMDKSNGKELLINGEKVTAEATFIAEEASGSIDVTFTFNATGLHGKEIVVFEDLYHEKVLLATHADIDDEGQTVRIRNPKIHTTATADGKKEIIADEITITDVVSYEDLTPGKEYKVSGILMDKATNDKLLIDGKEITAEATFTPKAPTGEVEMTFTFDARELTAETEVVAFETLYRDDLEFATHADITDGDQTVKILPLHGSISTIKVDAGDSQHRLSGAVFGIYRDVNGDGRYTEGIDTFVGNMREKETGVYELDGLLYGKFLIHEKQAPSGFSQDKNYYSFEITRDGGKVQFEVKPGRNFPNSAFPKTGSSNYGVYAALLALAVSGLGLGAVIFHKVKKESK